jgi:hypothetical protein
MACSPFTQVTFTSDPGCASAGPTLMASYGQCVSAGGFFAEGAKVALGSAMGGSCAPGGGDATLPPPASATLAAVCAAPAAQGAGCAAGACVPGPPSGYSNTVCVYSDGDLPCPAPYVQKTLIWSGVDDTRGCSACACDAPAGATCDNQVLVFGSALPSGATCSGGPLTFPSSAGCVHASNAFTTGVVLQPGAPPVGGSCAPSGGLPTGAVAGAKPTTVCCH